MARRKRYGLGLDFGTESVRAILVPLTGGAAGVASRKYRSGQITKALPTTGKKLPPRYALQDPADWVAASGAAVRRVIRDTGVKPGDIVGIGVDFTSCTMLPCKADMTPLCQVPSLGKRPLAWPKLWKHHAAQPQADRINELAERRGEPWLARYGGIVGLEWFFPKVLETFENDRRVYDAADIWLEGGDWYVGWLVGAPPRAVGAFDLSGRVQGDVERAGGLPV